MSGVQRSDPRLAKFLGELRAGADTASAAVVAEFSREEGDHLAAAEARGDYADFVAIEPAWAIFDGRLSFGRQS